MWILWSGCGTEPSDKAHIGMSKSPLRHVLFASQIIFSPAVSTQRRLAGCGRAQHVISVFVSGKRCGSQHPGLGSECGLPYLYEVP
jgi:hypothetical protein